MKNGFILIALTFFVTQASAQLDPSSGLLLNTTPATPNTENGLDSGRYKVRPHNDSQVKKQARNKSSEDEEDSEEASANKNPTPAVNAATATTVTTTTTVSASPAPNPQAQALQPVSPNNPPYEVHSLFNEQRHNLLDLSIAPVFIYNGSQSDSSYRKYSTSAPGLKFDVDIWFTPSFAFHTMYSTSLGGSVNDSFDHSKNANLTQQWYQIGVRTRSFSWASKTSPSITFGADYEDYQFQVDSDAQLRSKLETSGLNLNMLAQIPSSANYAWELGFEFMPKAKHQETSSQTMISSGDNPQANMIGLSLGGRIYSDSSSQFFWKVSERLEKDQFQGTTPGVDPSTNTQLSNVGVFNTFTMVELGFSWGN